MSEGDKAMPESSGQQHAARLEQALKISYSYKMYLQL